MARKSITITMAVVLLLTSIAYGSPIAKAYGDNAARGFVYTNTEYDEMFTDLNEAVFTTWKTEVINENGNYFRRNRIDVVDQNGYDHQGMVYVCEGSDDFTKAYREYLTQLTEMFGAEAGQIAGYRNAGVRGYRTYRDHEINFFGVQEVTFTDVDGIERQGMVVVVDGTDQYADKEWDIYSKFYDSYHKEK